MKSEKVKVAHYLSARRRKEPLGRYGRHCGKPKNLLGGNLHDFANGTGPALGIHDREYAKLFLSEPVLALAGDGKLKVVF